MFVASSGVLVRSVSKAHVISVLRKYMAISSLLLEAADADLTQGCGDRGHTQAVALSTMCVYGVCRHHFTATWEQSVVRTIHEGGLAESPS